MLEPLASKVPWLSFVAKNLAIAVLQEAVTGLVFWYQVSLVQILVCSICMQQFAVKRPACASITSKPVQAGTFLRCKRYTRGLQSKDRTLKGHRKIGWVLEAIFLKYMYSSH
jgi:hypothetical protein